MNLKNRINQLEKIRNKADPEEIKIRVIWDDHILIDGEKLTIAEYNKKYPDHKIVSWDDLPDDDSYSNIRVSYETKPYSKE